MWSGFDKDVKSETVSNAIQGFPVDRLAKERKEDSEFTSVPRDFTQHTAHLNATAGGISLSTNRQTSIPALRCVLESSAWFSLGREPAPSLHLY